MPRCRKWPGRMKLLSMSNISALLLFWGILFTGCRAQSYGSNKRQILNSCTYAYQSWENCVETTFGCSQLCGSLLESEPYDCIDNTAKMCQMYECCPICGEEYLTIRYTDFNTTVSNYASCVQNQGCGVVNCTTSQVYCKDEQEQVKDQCTVDDVVTVPDSPSTNIQISSSFSDSDLNSCKVAYDSFKTCAATAGGTFFFPAYNPCGWLHDLWNRCLVANPDDCDNASCNAVISSSCQAYEDSICAMDECCCSACSNYLDAYQQCMNSDTTPCQNPECQGVYSFCGAFSISAATLVSVTLLLVVASFIL